MEFEIGDVVQLNSGGPEMTVTYITEDGEDATCTWFDKTMMKHGDFPIKALHKVNE